MKFKSRFRSTPEVHTSALNDILFILLLFFLIVSTLANPNVVKVNNPKGKADTKTKQTIVVTIDKEDHYFIGQVEIPIANLESTIQDEVNRSRNYVDTPSVVINADTLSLTGAFFRVMTCAKKAGAKVVANVKS
ncbi:MAG: biopolymer transporter ExbD [Phycisphaerales bacterium]|nr:biopolymer transporter ExbD [Phycisphaerales bacterium]